MSNTANYTKESREKAEGKHAYIFEIHFTDCPENDSYRGTVIVASRLKNKSEENCEERERDYFHKIYTQAKSRAYTMCKVLCFHPWVMVRTDEGKNEIVRHYEAIEPLTKEKMIEIRLQAIEEEKQAQREREAKAQAKAEKMEQFAAKLKKKDRAAYYQAVEAKKEVRRLRAGIMRQGKLIAAGKKLPKGQQRITEADVEMQEAIVFEAMKKGWPL